MTSTERSRRLPAPRPACALAVLLLLAAATASAADADAEPVQLEPVVVVATRHPGEVWDVAASVTVLSAETAQAELASDLRDLFRYQPAIQVDGGGTRFGDSGFRIRGLGGNRVLTLIDGIPVAERFSVGSYADSGRDYADLGLVREVEVLRGPASSLYGSRALGGVVAIETLDPEDLLGRGVMGGRVQGLFAGDRDQLGASAALAWGQTDAGVLLAATRRQGHELDAADADTVDPQRWHRESLLAKSTLATGAGTLRLLADYSQAQRDTEVRTLLGQGRFSNTTALSADDAQDAWRAGASFEQAATGGRRVLWRAYATRAWLTQDTDEYRQRANPPLRQQRRFEFSQRTAGLGVDVRQPLPWRDREQILGYGIEAAAGRLQEGRDARQTNLNDGSQTTVLLGESFPRRDFPNTDTLDLGAYASAELRAPGTALTVLPGLRYDYYRLDARPDARFDSGSPRVAVTDLSNDAWTPRLGLLYPLGSNLRGFAQYTRGFRAPPAFDVNLGLDLPTVNARALPNPDLDPEHSDAVELGLRHRSHHAQAELSLFETRYRDFILSNGFIGTEPGTGTRLFQSRNVERALIRGLELRWRQDLAAIGVPGWSAELAGAWLRGENRDTDQPLPGVEPAKLVLGLDRSTARGALRLRLTAVDDRDEVDDSGTPQFQAPGYAVLDLLGELRPAPRLALRAGLFNALDRRYWAWSDVYGRPASDPQLAALARAGRYLSVSAAYTF